MFNNNLNMSLTKPLRTVLIIFFVSAIVCGDSAGANTNENSENTYVGAASVSIQEGDDAELPHATAYHGENLAIVLKLATECETPNGDIGFCVEIKNCSKLLKQLKNQNAKQFLFQSKCGPDNEEPTNPKVCCGKHATFKNKIHNQRKTQSISMNSNTNIVTESIEGSPYDHRQQIIAAGEESDGSEEPTKSLSPGIFDEECGKQNLTLHGRIIGGRAAELGEFPWMARLIHKSRHNEKSYGCSGFLITVKYVLTAAHCVHDKFITIRGPVYSVVLGEHDIETKTDCVGGICADPIQTTRVDKLLIHPNYDPENQSGHYNDISLIRVKKAAKRNAFVSPICLNANTSLFPEEYILSGWGKTETDQVSRLKMKVDLPRANKTECEDLYEIYNVTLKESQICAGGKKSKDSCNGDSGGPLMFVDNNVWYAAGIVSFGVGCGAESWPGVYTSIPHFVTWIENSIQEIRKEKRLSERTQHNSTTNT